jgi:hypothetical protein
MLTIYLCSLQTTAEQSRLEGTMTDLRAQYLALSWGKAVSLLTEKYGPNIDRKLTKHQGASKLSSGTKDIIKEVWIEGRWVGRCNFALLIACWCMVK